MMRSCSGLNFMSLRLRACLVVRRPAPRAEFGRGIGAPRMLRRLAGYRTGAVFSADAQPSASTQPARLLILVREKNRCQGGAVPAPSHCSARKRAMTGVRRYAEGDTR